ncbi:MAG: orotate phosphoribosyltransferase [Pseudanabaenaceae cyanobacterium]|jgi:orotate phosphoribosyltransferase
MTNIDSVRTALLDLICTRAYKSGDFTLSSGQKSTYYINGKQVTLDPFGALYTGQVLLPLLPAGTGAVAGLTLGADPIVAAVSVVSALAEQPVPALIVRKQTKGHGTMAWIEGPTLAPGTKVAVLEDVVTTGKSAMFAVEKLRDAGFIVEDVITLVDRQQGGAEFYAAQGLQFTAVFTIDAVQARATALGL